jgi:small subunit ribosomal protein S2
LYARGMADAVLDGRANAITDIVKSAAEVEEFVEVAAEAPAAE